MTISLDFLIKFLPAMIANASPVILAKLPYSQPINERLLGKNKTWKGLIIGSLIGGLMGHLLNFLYPILNFQVGLMMAVGGLLGDVVKSYFKRRMGKREGESWMPFDQIDWILGSLLFSYYIFSLEEIILIIVILPILHILTNEVAYRLKLKRSHL